MTDPFSSASSAFIKQDDLLDRLVILAPISASEEPSTMKGAKEGDTYTVVTCDVIVLDGEVTDKIEEVPTQLDELWISGQIITRQMSKTLRTKGLILGRMLKVKSTNYPSGGGAWQLADPTEADKALARPYAVAYLKAREEANDPFA